MSRRPRAPARIGAPPPRGAPATLLRALQPMLRQAKATARGVRTLSDVRALGAALRRAWPDARIRAIVLKAGRSAEIAGSRAWAPLERAAGRDAMDARRPKAYDGAKLVDAWTREATSLITSVRDEVAERLRKDVIAAAKAGIDPETLAADWVRRGVPVEWGTLEGRMQTIARHQLSVLHASVQSERARAVGVTEYIWRTQGDDRVRDEHVELEGERRSYSESPRPGEPVNCRCFAESVIPDELAIELGFAIG